MPTQRTLFQSLISILKRTMARGWGGGRVNCGRVNCGRVHAMFNQELTPLEPRPNIILSDLLHCYKNSFTLLEIIIGQEKIHGYPHTSKPYTHKTSGFKTSGFKTSGFKTSETSGLQNVRFTKCQVYKTSGLQNVRLQKTSIYIQYSVLVVGGNLQVLWQTCLQTK